MTAVIVSGRGPANAVVEIQPGMYVKPVVLVTNTGALVTPGTGATTAPGLLTGAPPPNTVMAVQPGMKVLPVVVVDGTGNFVYA